MNNVGIVKEIDKVGRICIPKNIRTRLKLEKEVEIIVTEEGVLIRCPEYVLKRKQCEEN